MFTLLPGSCVRTETQEKHSRFIATLSRTDNEEDARETVNRVRAEFPDARHNCSAFVIASNEGPSRTHSSDDGEPSGTAGPPILEVLLGADLVNVVAVVTRYFGGVLLGTGGLVRAYSSATRSALAKAPLAKRVLMELVEVQVPPEFSGQFLSAIHQRGIPILNESWGDSLRATLALHTDQIDEIDQITASLIHSPATLKPIGTRFIDIPLSA